jgi:glycine/D-amino acid oxidase-like deaminating enzyme
MRGTYGPDQPYTEMAAQALRWWERYERKWKRQLLHAPGVLWMAAARDDAFERGSIKALRAAKLRYQELSVAQLKKRWPQISFEGIAWGIFEPQGGYLEARESCAAVLEAFLGAGGRYQQLAVLPDPIEHPPLVSLALSDGSQIQADGYVFACGPWLGRLFPDVIGNLITATKQEVFFFGPPAGDSRFSDSAMPVWADHGARFRYGIPGSDRRGFKVADDTRGPEFDPTAGERTVNPETLREIREYVGFRFPDLKNAPLIETRVCQYEQTPDSHFIIDRHPASPDVWLLGGGSGHGFKHGPAIGDRVAEMILRDGEPERIWKLERFRHARSS